MLDQIDLDLKLSKRDYRRRLPELQARLYDMEQALLEAQLPVLLLFEGWAGTAKARTISVLTRRLDPRGLRVHPIAPPRTFESQYPWLYRFWLKIPSYGQLAIYDRSWYREILNERTHGEHDLQQWRSRLEDVVSFERQLADDGAVLLKFWLHISKKEQARRFDELLEDKLTAWRVTDEDHWQHRHYEQISTAVEDLIARTDTAIAPWQIIPSTDKYYARIAVIESVLAALEARLGRPSVALDEQDASDVFDSSGASFRRVRAALISARRAIPPSAPAMAPTPQPGPTTLALRNGAAALMPAPLRTESGILQRVDLSLKLDEKTYSRSLKRYQARLHLLGYEAYRNERPVVLLFEGWDAAGKGGAIQRVTEELDPRSYVVHAIAAPVGEDKIHHYLYRFWRRLPPRGQIAIFDRSWYGRVLVERVEGFARQDEWQRAYAEINEFERQLVEFGTIVCKFWVHISPEEQMRRFEERQSVPYKSWKLTDEDWRNREKWPLYEEATNEMLQRTSTPAAPWTIIESEDKRYGRVKVLSTVVQRLEAELGTIKL
jgi:polyphosphate kinase 2 (PPK2 family)